ncbi:MAG: NAD(+) synthase [Clostridia bacterium]
MDCALEVKNRVNWIKEILKNSNAKGIVYGNSGGKDCTLVGILCKMATDNVTGIIMPCESSVNYGSDRDDALCCANKFSINTIELDLTEVKSAFRKMLQSEIGECVMAYANINPRIRMTTLYAYAYKNSYLVAGTGNRSEIMMGYFTKWGDGAFDFNPTADLTVTEVYEMLRYLNAPTSIICKQPSAGLYEGQTDEKEMGISYKVIDDYLLNGKASNDDKIKIEKAISRTEHKRRLGNVYKR